MVEIIFVESLSVTHIFLLVSGILSLIPSFRLFLLFKRTRIVEYGLFSLVFLISTLFTITEVLAMTTDMLIFWMLSFSFRNFTYFLFFTYTIRMIWARPATLIVYLGVIQYAIIQLLILLWSPLENSTGAGFITNQDTVIYSTNHRLIAIIFQLYVASLFLYGFLSVKLTNPSKELLLSYRVMIFVSIALLVSRIIRFLQNFGILMFDIVEYVGTTFFLFSFILVAFVIFYNPGSFLISKAQIGGIIIISASGAPIYTLKFEESNLFESSTIFAGIINAIQSVLGSIDENIVLSEIDARSRSIIIDQRNNFYFMIITNTHPTSILKSSLRYFSKIFFEHYQDDIEKFLRTGVVIQDISDIIELAFPFTQGLSYEDW